MAARTFIDKDFLLTNDAARELYHTYAASLPIVDYHNHIDPRAIASDKCYEDMGELWVVSDPYKHRAMRIYGIPENRISGNAGRRLGRGLPLYDGQSVVSLVGLGVAARVRYR